MKDQMSQAPPLSNRSLVNNQTGVSGDCVDCGRRHSLAVGQAKAHALRMMEEFETLQRLDYLAAEADADPSLCFERVFAERGNMFGVLECVDAEGNTVFLRAFSALTGGARIIDGWVPPLLSEELYEDVILPAQREIKWLTTEMKSLKASGAPVDETGARRRRVSQGLWERMCSEYKFQNFRGEVRALKDAALPGSPIAGGMGECCAPKLLTFAVRNGLRPVGIAEFFWNGQTSGARTPEPNPELLDASRVSGEFYPSCAARCQPILGFMLCGLDT
jgi:hypothetical protein